VLSVAGDVDKAGFAALMEGRHPGTGERLKRLGGRSKVAAFDLTFSAPKSVSVLFRSVIQGSLAHWSKRTRRRSALRWTTWNVRLAGCAVAVAASAEKQGRGSCRRAIGIA
jgi:TrwC relaxase